MPGSKIMYSDISPKLQAVLDELAKVTTENPTAGEDGLVDFLFEAGELAGPDIPMRVLKPQGM